MDGPELGSDGPGWRRALSSAAVALLLLGLLNLAQVSIPELVTLEVDSGLQGVLLLAGAAAATVALLRAPTIALVSLVVLVAANLSEVLVRYHDLPSLLQLLALPLALTALVYGSRVLPHLLRSPVIILSGLYCLVVLASTTWAGSTSLADGTFVETARGVAILVLVALLASRTRRLQTASRALVITVAGLCALGVLQGLTGHDWGELAGFGRVKHAQIYGDVFRDRIAGPFGDPNFFAQILLLIVPLAFVLIGRARERARRRLYEAVTAVILGGIFFTYSRGAAVAVGVQALLALPWLEPRRRRAALIGGAVVAVLLLLLPTGFSTRLATINQLLPGQQETLEPDSSFEERRIVTTAAWRMFLDRPVLGAGAGNYTAHFDEYAAEIDSAARDYLETGDDSRHYPHNVYLEVAAETGMVGLVSFLALLLTAFLTLHDPVFQRPENRDLRPYARAFVLGLAGYLVAALFLHGQFQRPFWLVLGLTAALHTIARRRQEER